MDITIQVSIPPHNQTFTFTIQSPNVDKNETYFTTFLQGWQKQLDDPSRIFERHLPFVTQQIKLLSQTSLPQTLDTIITQINRTDILKLTDLGTQPLTKKVQPYIARVTFEAGMDYGFIDLDVYAPTRLDAFVIAVERLRKPQNLTSTNEAVTSVRYKTEQTSDIDGYDVPITEAIERDLYKIIIL